MSTAEFLEYVRPLFNTNLYFSVIIVNKIFCFSKTFLLIVSKTWFPLKRWVLPPKFGASNKLSLLQVNFVSFLSNEVKFPFVLWNDHAYSATSGCMNLWFFLLKRVQAFLFLLKCFDNIQERISWFYGHALLLATITLLIS